MFPRWRPPILSNVLGTFVTRYVRQRFEQKSIVATKYRTCMLCRRGGVLERSTNVQQWSRGIHKVRKNVTIPLVLERLRGDVYSERSRPRNIRSNALDFRALERRTARPATTGPDGPLTYDLLVDKCFDSPNFPKTREVLLADIINFLAQF